MFMYIKTMFLVVLVDTFLRLRKVIIFDLKCALFGEDKVLFFQISAKYFRLFFDLHYIKITVNYEIKIIVNHVQ